MRLEPVSAYLAAQAMGVEGQTIFINDMPASCTDGILLMDSYHGTAIDQNLPNYYRGGLRVAIRGKTYQVGYALALNVIKKLTIQGDMWMGDLLIKQLLPQNLPRPYRRSAGAYTEFEVDIDSYFYDAL